MGWPTLRRRTSLSSTTGSGVPAGTVSGTEVSDVEVTDMEAGGELGVDAGSGACPLLVAATMSTKRKIPKKRWGRRPVFIMGQWDAMGCASVVLAQKFSECCFAPA